MLPFIKLMRDHELMITHFHNRITERARKLVNVHAETASTGGYGLLDGTERAKKLAFLNTEVMETISADFAIAVSREGVVDKFFASVSEYPPALPIAILPEPHLPPPIKASNKFRVLSCLVLYSLYLMLQWGLLLKECKDISFNDFVRKLSNIHINEEILRNIDTKIIPPAWKAVVHSIQAESSSFSNSNHSTLTLNFLDEDCGDDSGSADTDASGLQPPLHKAPKLSSSFFRQLTPSAECVTDILPMGGRRLVTKSMENALPPPTSTILLSSLVAPPVSLAHLDTRGTIANAHLDVSALLPTDRQDPDENVCPLCQRHVVSGVYLSGCKRRHSFCKGCITTVLDFSSQVSPGSHKVFCPECGVSSDIPLTEFSKAKVDQKYATATHGKAEALLDSWNLVSTRLNIISSTISSRSDTLDSQIQSERTRISDTFTTLSAECSEILEERRQTAVGTIESLSKNLRAAFGGFARISHDVEEKTATLSALIAKANASGPRSQRRAAAKRAREILKYLDACYAPLLGAQLPDVSADMISEFRPIVSVGSSIKSFGEHVKDYATLVDT